MASEALSERAERASVAGSCPFVVRSPFRSSVFFFRSCCLFPNGVVLSFGLFLCQFVRSGYRQRRRDEGPYSRSRGGLSVGGFWRS